MVGIVKAHLPSNLLNPKGVCIIISRLLNFDMWM